MKLLIELTEEQYEELNEERGDLPMPSFLKSVFKFKSVEILSEEVTEITTTERHWLHDDVYELDRELSTI